MTASAGAWLCQLTDTETWSSGAASTRWMMVMVMRTLLYPGTGPASCLVTRIPAISTSSWAPGTWRHCRPPPPPRQWPRGAMAGTTAAPPAAAAPWGRGTVTVTGTVSRASNVEWTIVMEGVLMDLTIAVTDLQWRQQHQDMDF